MMNDHRPSVHPVDSKRASTYSVALLLTLLGCSSQAPQSTSSSSAPSSSASATLPPVVQADYCKSVCEHAASCGTEAALRMKDLEPEVKSAVEKSAPETTRVCIETCVAEPATPVRLQLAARCNLEKDCNAFAKCLGDLGHELKK